MEIKLAAARKEINFWKSTVPQAFALNQKILWLERHVHNAEQGELEAQHQCQHQKQISEQIIKMRDETIKGQRINLERLQELQGDDRKTAQFTAALHEQNYDRAAKIAHGEGPYLSPDKQEAAPRNEGTVEDRGRSITFAQDAEAHSIALPIAGTKSDDVVET